LLYAANLNAGDYLLPSSQLPDYVVNSTVSRSYTGGARDTNYMENTQINVDNDGDSIIDYVYRYSSRYFDRQTGILVEGYFEDQIAANPDQTFASAYKLTESNVWNVSGSMLSGASTSWFTTDVLYVIIIVVVLVAVVATLLLIRMRKSKKRRR